MWWEPYIFEKSEVELPSAKQEKCTNISIIYFQPIVSIKENIRDYIYIAFENQSFQYSYMYSIERYQPPIDAL